MKNIFTLISRLAFVLVAGTLVVSCENFMDKINEDNNHATNVTANFIIPELLLSTAQNVTGGDINTYVGAYNEQWVGTHNQLYRAELRRGEPQLATTFNNTWGTLYTNIRNAKIVVSKCGKGGEEEGDNLALAVGEIMLAYNAAFLTDMFGDAPFSQTGDYVKYMTPDIDTQESIYKTVNSLLDDAIKILEGKTSNTLASYDLLYKGDAESWLKFANGLKARYGMRLLYRAGTDADLQKIVDYVDASFEDASEQAEFNVYEGTNINPTFDFYYSRAAISPSKSMYDKLMAREDPRSQRAYWEWIIVGDHLYGKDIEKYLAPNGSEDIVESQCEVYGTDFACFGQYASVLLLSYHELQFIKAEALVRLKKNTDAEEALKKGIVAGMANFEKNIKAVESSAKAGVTPIDPTKAPVIDETAALKYYNDKVKSLFAADPLKETMIQKYIAMWGCNGESSETYNDIRRIKVVEKTKDIYQLANPNNATNYPVRLPYGADDTSANPKVKEAFGTGAYIYSDQVWWAGGTR